MVIVESAGLTDVGRKRKSNEDAFFIDDDLQLFVVADGMGGHQAGEVASQMVVETIRDYIKRFKQDDNAEELEKPDKALSKYANRLISSIHLSNKAVYQTAQSKATYRGMGSTVSAIYFTDDTMIASNVGDSPIYLIRGDTIELLSVTHTVLAEQLAIDPEAGKRFGREFSHVLTRAMGVEENVRPDICEVQCFRGDTLVISSDGLSDKLSMEDIFYVVNGKRPEKACRILVDMANERGGDDNITVVVIKVKKVQRKQSGIMRFLSWFFRK